MMHTIESPQGNSDFIFPVLEYGLKHSSLDKILSFGKYFSFESSAVAISCAYLLAPNVQICNSYFLLIFSKNSIVYGLNLV